MSFTGNATAPGNYVYYWAYTPGTTAAATPSQAKSSTSGTSLSWKYADRITGLSVSPHVVANNGRLTVKDQLQFYSDYKRQRVAPGDHAGVGVRASELTARSSGSVRAKGP